MTEFSNLFHEILRENGISVYNLAKLAGVDRSLLQKVSSGERSINYESFIKVYEYLRTVLEADTSKRLYEAFAKGYFGVKEYRAIRFIMERLQGMNENEVYIADKEVGIDEYVMQQYIEEAGLNKRQSELVLLFRDLILQANKEAEQGKKPRLYCYLPTGWGYVRNAILLQLRVSTAMNQIDFAYCCAGCHVGADSDLNLIENYLTACEFAQYGLATYGVMNNKEYFPYDLVPYYILTDDKLIFVFADGAFEICTNEDVANKVMKDFMKLIAEDEAFLTTDSMELCTNYDCLDGTAFVPMLDLKQSGEWEKCRQLFVNMEMIFGCQKRSCRDIKKAYDETLEQTENGVWRLRELCTYFSESGRELVLMNKHNFHMLSKFSLSVMAENLLVCSGIQTEDGIIQEGVAFVTSPMLVKHFRNFFEYLKHLDVCKSGDAALEILGNVIRMMEKEL